MIFKYDIQRIGKKDYIIASRLLNERGNPSGNYEFPRAFIESLIDEDGKLQWTIRENPEYRKTEQAERYLIEHDPVSLTPEEANAKQEREKQKQIQAQYPLTKIIELQDAAIQALARGKELPQKYNVYIAFREGINAKKQR